MGTGLLIAGLTVGTIGKVLLGVTVILVHGRIFKEHRIDKVVLSELHREKAFGIAGIILMVVGYALEVIFYTGTPLF